MAFPDGAACSTCYRALFLVVQGRRLLHPLPFPLNLPGSLTYIEGSRTPVEIFAGAIATWNVEITAIVMSLQKTLAAWPQRL